MIMVHFDTLPPYCMSKNLRISDFANRYNWNVISASLFAC